MTVSCRRADLAWLAILAVLALLAGCSAAGSDAVSSIDPDETVELLAERDDVTVIDVRTPEEYSEGHLADAQLLDLAGGEFAERVGDLDRDTTYVLYCRTGSRSAEAAEMMDELGFSDVRNAGAYDDLAAAGAATGS